MSSRDLSQTASGVSLPAHTPGPWGTEPYGRVVATCGNVQRGTVWASCDKLKSADECRANARLIAAAPELLQAAQTMLALVMLKYGNLDADVNTATDAARAAIAKALGTEARS